MIDTPVQKSGGMGSKLPGSRVILNLIERLVMGVRLSLVSRKKSRVQAEQREGKQKPAGAFTSV